ncbi:MAG: holo-ACP synthase [Cyanobacteria bacterium J06639_18]
MIRLGTDIVYIPRIQAAVERFGDRFLQRVYTPIEQQHCGYYYQNLANPSFERLAGRWAAKEAVVKALGTGWRGVSYTDVEIGWAKSGKPSVTLHERAAAVAATLGEQKSAKDDFSLLDFLQLEKPPASLSNTTDSSNFWQLSLSHDRNYAIATAIFVYF